MVIHSKAGSPFWLVLLMLAGIEASPAATYHVALTGSDSNPGTEARQWRTIAKAVDVAQAGDVVFVHPGAYDERVTTLRGGTSDNQRIRFEADGLVQMRGWRVHHPYITVRGFHITGHTHADNSEGFVRTNNSGDHLELENCLISDGFKVVDTAVEFVSPSTIRIPGGGLVANGFGPGVTFNINRASPTAVENTGGYAALSVTDTEIVIQGASIANEGPVPAFLAPSAPYGLYLATGSENCRIRGNTFRNLAFDTWFIMGANHLIEGNSVEQTNGWDAMHFGGAGHVFRRNVFRNSPLSAYQNSPDAWENYTPVPYQNVLFYENVVQNFIGVLASQKGELSSNGLIVRRNVFVDVGRFNLTHPGTTIEQNTFVRVARHQQPGVSRASHPIAVNTSIGAVNAVIRNNIFLDCGEPSNSQSLQSVGWYQINGPLDGVTATGNFVSGVAPAYDSKIGWPETQPSLNGGDPGLVDLVDVFGPDGVAFTADDGLRPGSTSKLIGAGDGGHTPGAYAPSADDLPDLAITWEADGKLKLAWPETSESWMLEQNNDLEGEWVTVPHIPVLGGGNWTCLIESPGARAFFRLAQQ